MAACCMGLAKICGATQLDAKMPKKVVYFGLKTPVAMPSMCLLEMSGKSYEGRSVQFEEWGDLKPKTPGGSLPYADMPDGSQIAESGAIGRTIAAAAGLLGQGADFSMSEMLVGIATDLNKEYSAIAPTIMTVKDFGPAKKANFVTGKGKVLEYVVKLEKWLLPSGDRFTKSGLTYGEVLLFSYLHCYSQGALPEIACGKLKPFYDRMAAVPGIKRVVEGKSKFGALGNYLIPIP